MTIEEIEKEIETVERGAISNNDSRYVAGIIARGVWQIVLQLAKLNEQKDNWNSDLEDAHHYRDAVKHGHLEPRP